MQPAVLTLLLHSPGFPVMSGHVRLLGRSWLAWFRRAASGLGPFRLFLVFFVMAAALAVSVACGEDDPVAVPAGSGSPVSSPAVTGPAPAVSAGSYREIRTRTPGPVREQFFLTGSIRSFDLSVPGRIMLALSETDLLCLSGVVPADRIEPLLSDPSAGSRPEQAAFVNCLPDELLLRFFLAGVIGGGVLLGAETSDCIRSGILPLNLRGVMQAGQAGDSGSSYAGSMAALVLVVSCLGDDDVPLVPPDFTLRLADRDAMRCILDRLGGVAPLAAMYSAVEGDAALEGMAIWRDCWSRFTDFP